MNITPSTVVDIARGRFTTGTWFAIESNGTQIRLYVVVREEFGVAAI